MCRRTEEVGPTVGLSRHMHFVGFSNVHIQAPTCDQPFYGYYKKPSHLSHLYYAHRDTEDLFLSCTLRVCTGEFVLFIILV